MGLYFPFRWEAFRKHLSLTFCYFFITCKLMSWHCRSLILNDTKTIKEAFNDNAVSGRPAVPIFHDRSSGTAKGIIFTEGTKWQEQRRFTLRHLRDFGFGRKSMEAIIAEEALELTDRLKAHEGKPISTDNAFNAAIINALWSLLTGDRFKQDDPELAHALQLLTT